MTSKFYRIKEEIRILGLDDAAFKRDDAECMVVGTVFRGGLWLDGVLSMRVTVDGIDATDQVVDLVLNCKFKDLRIIMLDGLGFAGFNHVDIERIFEETGLPVIVIVRKIPDFREIKSALKNLPDFDFRWMCVEKAGTPVPVETKPGKKIYIQFKGLSEDDACHITRLSSTRSMIPEPVRVAHLIGQGIVLGQSRGKA